MLIRLNIKNLLLVSDISIDFTKNLNIITGETGAGKSMIIGSLQILFGSKVNAELIRNVEEQAIIEGLFTATSKVKKYLEKLDIECDDDLIIRRNIVREGKSRTYVNDVMVSNSTLKNISYLLVDLHSQNDHYSLLDSRNHIDFLDAFLNIDLSLYKETYKSYNELLAQQNAILNSSEETKQNISFLKFQLSEIKELGLYPNVVDELLQERHKLKNYNKFCESASEIKYLLNEKDGSILSMVENLKYIVNNILGGDNLFKKIISDLDDVHGKLYEIKDAVDCWQGSDEEYDNKKLDEIELRLFKIEELKRKYKKDINGIIDYYNNIQEKINQFDNMDFDIKELKKNIQKKYNDLENYAIEISEIRKKNAHVLEKEIEETLKSLGMEYTRFFVKMDQVDFNKHGINKIEFYISTNKGMKEGPLGQIASGGEVSRLLLALKIVFAKFEEIPTLVFDEIDVNIGGTTARNVGSKLKYLSKSKQIISITHIPQIACYADAHYLISKKVEDDTTSVDVFKLNRDMRIKEIARMLGGEELTSVILKHAEELIGLSKD